MGEGGIWVNEVWEMLFSSEFLRMSSGLQDAMFSKRCQDWRGLPPKGITWQDPSHVSPSLLFPDSHSWTRGPQEQRWSNPLACSPGTQPLPPFPWHSLGPAARPSTSAIWTDMVPETTSGALGYGFQPGPMALLSTAQTQVPVGFGWQLLTSWKVLEVYGFP